jgi:hypothetical protein
MMFRIAALCMMLITTAGCSSIKTYPNTLTKNMRVSLKLDSNSLLSNHGASLDVYSLDAKCEINHEGRIELETAATEVGLPTNRPIYIEFIFANSSMFPNRTTSTRYGMLFTPHLGIAYQVKAVYSGGIYDVVIRDNAGRPVEQGKLSDCKARS